MFLHDFLLALFLYTCRSVSSITTEQIPAKCYNIHGEIPCSSTLAVDIPFTLDLTTTKSINLEPSVTLDVACGTNIGQPPCPTKCYNIHGEIPCSSTLVVEMPSTSIALSMTTTSVSSDTTVASPLQATATGCNDIEECDREANKNRPSCKTADDCGAPCRAQFANNTAALQFGFASTCINKAFCTCSVEVAEAVDEIIVEIGDVVCVVWKSAIPIAFGLLQFVAPYTGKLAEGVDAQEFFTAAGKVFKKGSKDCNAGCSQNADGQKFTAVDALNNTSWEGIFACDDSSVPPASVSL